MGYYQPVEKPSSFRKLAAAMWRAPNDPHIFGSLDIDMTDALAFLAAYNTRSAHKVTVTHMVARALAIVLAKHPEVNAKVTWWRLLQRKSVDLFCQVSTDSGRDLSGARIEAADTLSLEALAGKLSGAAQNIRTDKDPAFRRSRNLFRALPLWGVRMVIGLMSFLTNTLNLHLPRLGMPRDPFGSAMVTSVGMFDIDTGFAPFTPIARCPIVVTVTKIKQRPWVVSDRVEPRPILRLCGAFDHRVVDGFHAGALSSAIEKILSDPAQLILPTEPAIVEKDAPQSTV